MYVLYKLEYTYISKYERVHKNICMKASGSRMYMYNYQFRQNRHIHEANHKHEKHAQKQGIQVKMHESSKLGYTSTSTEYK